MSDSESASTELLAKLVQWIVNHPPSLPDHACCECVPHSDMLVDGWRCGYHEALRIHQANAGHDISAERR